MTAVFQSNQNDRVTLERQREDIFLASHSPRDALFPVFCFFFFSNTDCRASIGTLVYRTELMRRSGLSAEGEQRGD